MQKKLIITSLSIIFAVKSFADNIANSDPNSFLELNNIVLPKVENESQSKKALVVPIINSETLLPLSDDAVNDDSNAPLPDSIKNPAVEKPSLVEGDLQQKLNSAPMQDNIASPMHPEQPKSLQSVDLPDTKVSKPIKIRVPTKVKVNKNALTISPEVQRFIDNELSIMLCEDPQDDDQEDIISYSQAVEYFKANYISPAERLRAQAIKKYLAQYNKIHHNKKQKQKRSKKKSSG